MKKEYTHKELGLINDSLNYIKATSAHYEYLIALYDAIADMEVYGE